METTFFSTEGLENALTSQSDVRLHYYNATVGPRDIKRLCEMKRLRGFGLAGASEITAQELEQLARRHPRLEELSLGGHASRDASVYAPLMAQTPKRVLLAAFDASNGLPFQRSNMEALRLEEGVCPPAKEIAEMRSLRFLRLGNVPIDAAVMEAVASLPALKTLEITSSRRLELLAGLSRLQASRSLERIVAVTPALEREDISALQRIASLRELVLAVDRIETVEALSALENPALSLGVTCSFSHQLSDALIARLVELVPTLQQLDFDQHNVVGRCKNVSCLGLEPLARLQQLRSLNLDGMGISKLGNANLDWLLTLPRLESLAIGGVGKITPALLATIGKIKTLRSLNLGRLAFTDASLKKIAGLGLESLSFYGAPITAKGFAQLAALPKLRWLNMHVTEGEIDDAGLQALSSIKTLEFLSISEFLAKLNISSFASLAALPKLRELGYSTNTPTALTEAQLDSLCQLPAIETLEVSRMHGTDFTATCVTSMLKNKTLERISIDQHTLSREDRIALEEANRFDLGGAIYLHRPRIFPSLFEARD